MTTGPSTAVIGVSLSKRRTSTGQAVWYSFAGINIEIIADPDCHCLLATEWIFAGCRRSGPPEVVDLQVNLALSSNDQHSAWSMQVWDHASMLPNGAVDVLLGHGFAVTGVGRYTLTAPDRSALLPALNELSSLAILAAQQSNGAATVHAASLSRGGQGLLLIGNGFSGKTTLSLALAATGWTLLGDDACVITSTAMMEPLPLRINLRRGSFELLTATFPELFLRYQPAFAARERVLVDPVELFPDSKLAPCPPRWVVVVEGFGSTGGPELRRLSRGVTLARVAPQLRLATVDLVERLDRARALVANAECYALRAGALGATLETLGYVLYA
ncbi:MAG: hypothetical protein EPO21_18775 [Chloroflexota bacterium]|nr:MAG: hypothetical protein EPO21_18775 [Chloroflexota bacterium]